MRRLWAVGASGIQPLESEFQPMKYEERYVFNCPLKLATIPVNIRVY
jgi:hypothetical protein